jgi:hypothetical protein
MPNFEIPHLWPSYCWPIDMSQNGSVFTDLYRSLHQWSNHFTRYEKILWWRSLGCKIIFNFFRHTVRFYEHHHTNIYSWIRIAMRYTVSRFCSRVLQKKGTLSNFYRVKKHFQKVVDPQSAAFSKIAKCAGILFG